MYWRGGGVHSPVMSAQMEDDELAEQWHDLMATYHRTSCALECALLADHGLTVSEFEILQQLARAKRDETVRMHDLAEHVHLTQSALSRVVTRLEKASLVDRGTCADDRRSVWVQLTEAGRESFEAAKPTHRAILRNQA
jgi:DNA-binding MarR family transcriptional regulator